MHHRTVSWQYFGCLGPGGAIINSPVCPPGCPKITLAEVAQFEAVLATGFCALVVLKHANITIKEVSGPGQSQLPPPQGA